MIENYAGSFTKKASERLISKLHFHIEEIEKQDLAVFNGTVENIGASKESSIPSPTHSTFPRGCSTRNTVGAVA